MFSSLISVFFISDFLHDIVFPAINYQPTNLLIIDIQPPADLYQGAVAAGTKKAQNSFGNIFKLGIVAGCHIAFGAFLAISVGGACPGIAKENPGLQKVRALHGYSIYIYIYIYINIIGRSILIACKVM